jgi:short-subunit dehydrogenase
MEAFSDTLRRELIPHGVSVSIVEPGYVKSSIFGSSDENSKLSDEAAKNAREVYPNYFSEEQMIKRQRVISLADEPTVTTFAIKDAITSQYPKTRYPVANAGGLSANMLVFLVWILPDRALDLFAV